MLQALLATILVFFGVCVAGGTNSTGIRIQNGFERVYIQPYGINGFRVRASLMRDPTGNEWSAFLDPPIDGPGANQGLSHDIHIGYNGNATIENGDLVAQVANGVLSFWRVEADGSRTILTSEYTDTKAVLPRFYTQNFLSSFFSAQLSFTSEEDEQFYGLGQQACCKDHFVNKKGRIIDLYNFNSQVTLPVYMSNKGYMQFFNMPSQGRIEFGSLRTRFVSDEASVVDYWITTASPGDYDALQHHFTGVTGRQPTPPNFMLGYQQSKLRYYNQSQVIDVAQRFHDEVVNVSLLVVDYFAWRFHGDWSFNEDFWPDPAGMAAQVKDLTGAEMMVSVWPSVEDLSVNYIALQRTGLLATTRDGTGIHDSYADTYIRLIDSTNPASREFLWKRLNDSYFSKGMHNFWIDVPEGGSLGEPVVNVGQSMSRIPYSRGFTQYYIGTQQGTGKMYPFFHQKAINEGLHNLTGTDDSSTSCQYMSLARSTFIGGQRYCSYLWSGDTSSEFATLRQQITAGVSVAASGISSWTLDIGGFTGLNVEDDDDRELFVRWLAMGTFLPYMRVHGNRLCSIPQTDNQTNANPCPNEPWSFGDENFVIIKKYIALRYQLVPYIARLFEMLQQSGKTIMRALFYDFSLSDPFVAEGTRTSDPLIVYQFLLGPRILVAPVGDLGATRKEVYLPILSESYLAEKYSWKHWWTDKDFGTGGKTMNVTAALDMLPVFYLGDKEDIVSGQF